MFWTCPLLQTFWNSIFSSLSDILQVPVVPSPLIALFGVFPATYTLSKRKSNLVAFLTHLARRLILLHWKKTYPPSHTHWVKDVLYFMKLEKINHTLKGSIANYYKAWGPFLKHLDDVELQDHPDTN